MPIFRCIPLQLESFQPGDNDTPGRAFHMYKSVENEKWRENLRRYRFDQMLAGILSGGSATIILHPLDLVKTQFQVQTTAKTEIMSKPYLYTFRYLKDLYNRFGLRKGLYQGLSANLAGSTASWGLYFFLYDWKKTLLPTNSQGNLSSSNYFIASSLAASVTVLCTNPLWMIKTRLCMQIPGNPSNYTGLFNAFWRISREEGLRGLYRGLVPGLFGVSHGAIQFMIYEQLKNFHRQYNNSNINDKQQTPNSAEFLIMSSTSKVIAMIVTYPYQVVRSRLQVRITPTPNTNTINDSSKAFTYKGVIDVIKRTARVEGIWAFYRGIIPGTIRVLPGTCITFLVYEKVTAAFRK